MTKPNVAQCVAAMKWYRALSPAEMLAVRKHIPVKTVAAIAAYWLEKGKP